MAVVGLPEGLITAPAQDFPCIWYLDHGSSRPVRTQGHHDHPMYLQKRLWGEVRIDSIRWSCGTCHDSIHTWVSWLMGELRSMPMEPPYRLKREAERVVAWYSAEEGKMTVRA